MDFFTSDTHFNHHTTDERNIIKFCNRPYANVEEMNKDLIRRWNSVVGPEDRVYHLGDFALSDPASRQEIFDQLNGEKWLIEGNHDGPATRNLGWHRVEKRHNIYTGGYTFELVHNPAHATPGADGLDIHVILHGHLHGMSDLHPFEKIEGYKYIDVGVDVWGYYPISMNAITEAIHLYKQLTINEGK